MLEAICIGVALSSMIIAGVSLTMACICWSKVTGMEKSTHQIQYVPMETAEGESLEGKALDKRMEKAFSEEYIERDQL